MTYNVDIDRSDWLTRLLGALRARNKLRSFFGDLNVLKQLHKDLSEQWEPGANETDKAMQVELLRYLGTMIANRDNSWSPDTELSDWQMKLKIAKQEKYQRTGFTPRPLNSRGRVVFSAAQLNNLKTRELSLASLKSQQLNQKKADEQLKWQRYHDAHKAAVAKEAAAKAAADAAARAAALKQQRISAKKTYIATIQSQCLPLYNSLRAKLAPNSTVYTRAANRDSSSGSGYNKYINEANAALSQIKSKKSSLERHSTYKNGYPVASDLEVINRYINLGTAYIASEKVKIKRAYDVAVQNYNEIQRRQAAIAEAQRIARANQQAANTLFASYDGYCSRSVGYSSYNNSLALGNVKALSTKYPGDRPSDKGYKKYLSTAYNHVKNIKAKYDYIVRTYPHRALISSSNKLRLKNYYDRANQAYAEAVRACLSVFNTRVSTWDRAKSQYEAAIARKAKMQYFNTRAAKKETASQAANRAVWNPR